MAIFGRAQMGRIIRTPNVYEKFDFGFFGQSDNFHLSKVAHFFSFCEARLKMVSKKRRATKLAFLKNEFLLWFLCVLLSKQKKKRLRQRTPD